MFGNGENQIVHMVRKHQWDKIEKKLQKADAQTKVAFALACGESSDEKAVTHLTNLLQDSDETVLTQAVKSLGAIGHSSTKTPLQWLSNNLPEGKQELRKEIEKAIAEITERK